MFLVREKIMPPKEWEHNPNITNLNGFTVAMYIAHYS